MDHTCNRILWIKNRLQKLLKNSAISHRTILASKKINAIINNEHFVSAFELQVPCDGEKSRLFKKIHIFTKYKYLLNKNYLVNMNIY